MIPTMVAKILMVDKKEGAPSPSILVMKAMMGRKEGPGASVYYDRGASSLSSSPRFCNQLQTLRRICFLNPPFLIENSSSCEELWLQCPSAHHCFEFHAGQLAKAGAGVISCVSLRRLSST